MRRSTGPKSVWSSKKIKEPDPKCRPRGPGVLEGERQVESSLATGEHPGRTTHEHGADPRLSGIPPAMIEKHAEVVPNGTSYTPGETTAPETQNSLGPLDCSVPIVAKASAPP